MSSTPLPFIYDYSNNFVMDSIPYSLTAELIKQQSLVAFKRLIFKSFAFLIVIN